ncbi:hypothetical protein D3C85_149330 [compost metagenome]
MTPQDQANHTYHEIVRRGLEGFDSAVEAINAGSTARIRNVREKYFQAVILPILRKRVRNEVCEDLGVWLNTADGLHNPMNIVDDTGTLLFVCPPAFIDQQLNTKPPEGRFTTTHHVVQQQADMIANGDMRGIMAIEEGIYEAHKPQTEMHHRADAIMLLVDIYKFYQIPMEELLGPQANEILALANKRDSTKVALPTPHQEEIHDEPSDDDLIY